MSLWDEVQIQSGGGGMWDRLARHLEDQAGRTGQGLGIWEQISVSPGGLWKEARDETLVLARGRGDIWHKASEETLVIRREPAKDVWKNANEETMVLRHADDGLWETVEAETLIIARPRAAVWNAAQGRNFSNYKPERALGWALKKLATANGETYYVLKNLRQGGYLQLTEQHVYLWDLMDGAHSVQDLVVANFLRYKTLSPEWLVNFIGQLQAKEFLAAENVNVYQAAGRQLWRRSLDFWMWRLVGWLFQSQIEINGIDRYVTALYRLVGPIIFNRPAQVLIALVSLAGLPAYIYIVQRGGISFITGTGDSVRAGIITLIAAELLAVFVHENAHALTTKHYKRQVRKGGVGLYFGMLAFFVDTTDIWMEPRRPRLAVTWAGPYSGFFLGGLASLALVLQPAGAWSGLAYQFATFCYVISFLNLNPLLKLDGYFLLMDWLEMPMLRERSIDFVRAELWSKLLRREALSRDERIFAVFGILALVWTALAICAVIWLYGRNLFGFVSGFAGEGAAWALAIALLVVLAVMLIRRLPAQRR